MSRWLDPLRQVLDAAETPVRVFVRDDDAGWEDARLFALLDLFAAQDAPIDLAVIPTELTERLALELLARHATGAVGLHQHGYCHANHQAEGRKCEFGPARTGSDQRDDIAEGQRILRDGLGDVLDPIFTPPWNRCTAETGMALAEFGFRVLSRDRTAVPLAVDGLDELPVQVDWFASRHGERLSRVELGAVLAERAAEPAPLGLMLHHAVTGDDDLAGVGELLAVLAGHPNVLMRSMADVALAMNPTSGEIT